jgi:hypothetical protein
MNTLLLLAAADPATSTPDTEHPMLYGLLAVIIAVRLGLIVVRVVAKPLPGSPAATFLTVLRWALVAAALAIIVVINQKS